MKHNPITRFFNAIKKLEKAANIRHTDPEAREKYWFYTNSIDCKIDECFKREDGLWEQKDKINTHMPHGGQIKIGIWRIEPNYCCHGRPIYTPGKVQEYLDKSETEKVLYVHNGYEFVWKWDYFDMPTDICWGLRQGPRFFELRKDGEILVQSDKKTVFRRLCNDIFGIPNKEPKPKRKYTIETEKLIKKLESEYAHASHCEEQVQWFYKPADKLGMFQGSPYWDGISYGHWNGKLNARESVAREIKRLTDGSNNPILDGIDKELVRFEQVADYYKEKVMA
jgi:hypothetical protein